MTKKELNSLRYKLKPSDFLSTKKNEEWREELRERAKVWGDCAFVRGNHENDELNDFIATQIAEAEKRGEKKGVEKTMDEWNNAISNLPAERQEIRQAKIEEQDRILKEIWKRIEWNRKEENQWDGLVIANTRINAFTMAMDIVREPDNQGE